MSLDDFSCWEQWCCSLVLSATWTFSAIHERSFIEGGNDRQCQRIQCVHCTAYPWIIQVPRKASVLTSGQGLSAEDWIRASYPDDADSFRVPIPKQSKQTPTYVKWTLLQGPSVRCQGVLYCCPKEKLAVLTRHQPWKNFVRSYNHSGRRQKVLNFATEKSVY
jgi:hypothetical protein